MVFFGFDAGIVAAHSELGVADAPAGISTFRIVNLDPDEIEELDHTAIYGRKLQTMLIADIRATLGLPIKNPPPSALPQGPPEVSGKV